MFKSYSHNAMKIRLRLKSTLTIHNNTNTQIDQSETIIQSPIVSYIIQSSIVQCHTEIETIIQSPIVLSQTVIHSQIIPSETVIQPPIVPSQNDAHSPIIPSETETVIQPPIIPSQNDVHSPIILSKNVIQPPIVSHQTEQMKVPDNVTHKDVSLLEIIEIEDIKPIILPQHSQSLSEQTLKQNMEKILKYQELPLYKQKSQQWLDQRNNYLTASTIAAALGLMGKVARDNLLIGKVSNGTINSFNGNIATHWGNKYEPVANHVYAYRNNVKIYDFGMVTNDKYPFLGVSPDGITPYRMLEIKCPWSRVIDGKIKTEYYHQMQEQMAICEFDNCDFLECKFIEVSENQFWDDFYYYDRKDNINHEKGIIISYINVVNEEIEYMYSPIEHYHDIDDMKNWENQTIKNLLNDTNTIFLNESYWYMMKYNCQLVRRDPLWITEYYPVLQKFWDEVTHYRKVGINSLLEKINKDKLIENGNSDSDQDLPITNFINTRQPNSKSIITSKVTPSKNKVNGGKRCLL